MNENMSLYTKNVGIDPKFPWKDGTRACQHPLVTVEGGIMGVLPLPVQQQRTHAEGCSRCDSGCLGQHHRKVNALNVGHNHFYKPKINN